MSAQLKNLRADVDKLSIDFQSTVTVFPMHPAEQEIIEHEFDVILSKWLILLKRLETAIQEGN